MKIVINSEEWTPSTGATRQATLELTPQDEGWTPDPESRRTLMEMIWGGDDMEMEMA